MKSPSQPFRPSQRPGQTVAKGACAAVVLSLLTPVSFAQAPNPAVAEVPVQATVTVQAGSAGKAISPDLFGIFFEDINYAADGGLYAELVQDRGFEYSPADRREWHPLSAWDLVQRGDGKGTLTVGMSQPMHANSPHYAVLSFEKSGDGVGLRNEGFDGIAVKTGEKYNLSLFARQLSGTGGPLRVRLENKEGAVIAEAQLTQPGTNWKKYTASLEAKSTTGEGRLVVLASGSGHLALDMVSLFPAKTFRNRPNGLRADLAQTIADLKPKFIRFPGGCLVHGNGLENIYQWKDTVGPVEQRRGQNNIWGYHQSVGLGYHEYFQFCEDIGAAPLPVVAAGVSCQNSHAGRIGRYGVGQQGLPMNVMDAYVQDVLDLIEYANGPVSSKWGSKRAAAGHPKPFGLKYLGVGNEDEITPVFKERFEMINRAIKAKHPEITVIGTVGPAASGTDFDAGWKIANDLKLEMVDEHYYMSPEWFLSNLNRYDSYNRSQSKVYLGEYASRGNTLFNALAEAAYMTGLERNGDIVHLSSYAPLIAKTGRTQWNPDLIYFDNIAISPSVNYYVQQLFGQHPGNRYLPNTVDLPTRPVEVKPASAFLGTWNTQAQFENVRLESGPNSVLNPAEGAGPANNNSAGWQIENGVYNQSGTGQPALYKLPNSLVAGVGGKPNYTLSLRARKTGGQEGFLIGFGATDASNYYWWNLGGWNNSQHGVERHINGSSQVVGTTVAGRIETNRWYDIKIVVDGQRIRCFLDGRLIHDVRDTSKPINEIVAVSSVRDSKTGDIILKLVNVMPSAVQSQINLAGLGAVKPTATRIVLSGDPRATNSFEKPRNIVPQTAEIAVGKSFSYLAPPHSFTVIRLQTR